MPISGNNVISYTSRTFNTIMNDINSNPDLVDKPDWIKKVIAGVADDLFMNLNAQANNSFLRTAFTRRAVQDLLDLIDYKMSPQSTAVGMLTFYISRSASYPQTFSAADLSGSTQGSTSQSAYTYNADSGVTVSSAPTNTVSGVNTGTGVLTTNAPAGGFVTGDLIRIASSVSLPTGLSVSTDYYVITTDGTTIKLATTLANAFAGTFITLSSSGSGTITTTKYSFSVSCSNTITISTPIQVAVGDGSDWQEYQLPVSNILQSTVTVLVNAVGGWSLIQHWISATSTAKNFRVYYDSNNNATLAFGGNGYGLVPSGPITVSYATGGGSSSNVSNLNRIVNYVGGNTSITGCTNTTTFTGGSDPQSITSAVNIAPAILSATNRFVTTADGSALASSQSGVGLIGITRNYYGANSCQVAVVPVGGGTPSPTLLSTLQAYLITLTILNSVNVQCVAPTYSVVGIVGTGNCNVGYTWSNVYAYLTLALKLVFTERGAEFVSNFNTNGIASTVILINAQWGTSFSASDYTVISSMLSNLTSAAFGVCPTLFQLDAYCSKVVPGLTYVTISSPSLPLTLLGNQITQAGTVSITQV